MNLIVETDLGHDPDDFFALCYLHSAGVNIRAIILTVGHPYQVELARFFCDQVGLDIPIGTATFDPTVLKTGGVHFHSGLLKAYNYKNEKPADALGHEIISSVREAYPDVEFFVCGPPKSFGRYLQHNPDTEIDRVTVQGGFLSYSLYPPKQRLEKFENQLTVPTYNLNGAKKETQAIVDHNGIKALRFVSKNICHTVVYNKKRHAFIKSFGKSDVASKLFERGMDLYLSKHSEKKFHDPTAAVCHLHPEIASWYRGRMYSEKGGWGTRANPNSNSETIADIDYEALWHRLGERS